MKTLDPKNLAMALFELTEGVSEAERSEAVKEFAKYLNRKGLLRDSEKIIKCYNSIYNKHHNITEATVTLINRLPEKTRIHLREALKEKYKAKEVHILEKVDARLIGGMKIKVGDTIYDSSLKHSLHQLETRLLK